MPGLKFILVVKGDLAATMKALQQRSVLYEHLVKHPEFNECVVHANDTPIEVFTEWFNDSAMLTAPFPEGTLLWFGPRQ